MKKILNSAGKSIFTGSMFAVGILVVILGVSAFESLGTTPGTAGNQSLSSPILSKFGGVFDRDTMSLEALSEKINANETKIDINSTKLDTNLTQLGTNSTDIATVDTKVTALSGGGVSWAGYTTSTYYGYTIGSTKGFAAKCNTDFPGSKPMTYEDWLNLGSEYPSSQNAWLIDGSYSAYYNSATYQFSKDGNHLSSNSGAYPMCGGWSGNYYGPYIHAANGEMYINACTSLFKLPCVYK